MILWVMRECGAKSVPSFQAFRKMQTHLRSLCGASSEERTSSLGNRFYVNNIRDHVKKVQLISLNK